MKALYTQTSIISKLQKAFYEIFSAESTPTKEHLFDLLLSILCLNGFSSVNYNFEHFIQYISDNKLNKYRMSLSEKERWSSIILIVNGDGKFKVKLDYDIFQSFQQKIYEIEEMIKSGNLFSMWMWYDIVYTWILESDFLKNAENLHEIRCFRHFRIYDFLHPLGANSNAKIFAKKAVFISLSALFYNLNFTDSGKCK